MRTIRDFRHERSWTQFQLALAVGVQPQTIYLWESGRRLPQVPQLRKLGEVFGICSDEINLELAAESHDRPRRDQHVEMSTRDTTE